MKNILVVGGSSGIGRKLCQVLNKDDYRIYATYHSNPVVSDQPNLVYHQLNVLDDLLSFDFVPDNLHGLVYCPGSINLKPFDRIKQEDFLQDFSLQVGGAIKVIQGVLRNLKNSENASLVLFSTVAVKLGLKFHTQVSTSKGAIEGLCHALAAELAPNIRVNCISPSLTDTPLAARLLSSDEKKKANADRHPLQRVGTAEDIAQMAAFLLSAQSGWITGQNFRVDGGLSTIH